ncbi:alpha-1,6-mannosyl-glycoprotein 2-beta-N-acetylglucosaminyltransferase [Antechinus flavipes]|uniref:alpha-1,6-mannosyl-glycoprotein 2-beta-N-acetylglucosaminyltransferase n=1 Tax=Antechinus flavipes TaxID=38775 RepID=UPI002236B001|nr:alpha-1,6-mannosyl-glycoprotein 2-beta-N-acetylglucosaminyltransferase [Antechinus flavipes]
MRFRIYKRKVLILTLVVAACGFVFWNSNGRQRKNEAFAGSASAPARVAGPGDLRRFPNGTAAPPPEVDNMTLVYRSLVYQVNFDQTLRNAASGGAGAAGAGGEKAGGGAAGDPAQLEPELVLVVQVHNRPDYLKLLLDSLRRVQGIGNLLVIFSHDFWSAEINQLIAGIDFCPVLQVFFPFSIQLYPNEFPGNDPKDCPRDLQKKAALKMGCINAEYPDSFGHYREAKFSQTKHHWWWKLHFVWERVKILHNYAGLIVFLEEDHYLSPDFFHVLKKMWKLKPQECPECDVLSLGSYSVSRSFFGKADKVEVKTWKSTEHNMGLVLTRDTYEKLIECTDTFCTYDDYNWDWTLQYLTTTCLKNFWKVMVPEVPRIYHAGDCGMHHKDPCRPSTQSAQIELLLNKNKQYLFPKSLSIIKKYALAPLLPHGKNGGWGDIRDHELCKSYRRLQ